MSLLYDANGDQISHASVSPAESGGVLVWVYLSAFAVRMQAWHHSGADLAIALRGDLGQIEAFRGATTSYWSATVNVTAWGSLWGTGKYLCLAWLYGGGAPDLLLGDESTPLTLPGAYVSRTTGAGTVLTTASTFLVGNSSASNVRWVRERVGAYAWFDNYRPSQAEAEAWRLNPFGYLSSEGGQFPTPYLFCRPGSNGTTDVPDDTGNGNTGTITGLSAADSQPFIPFNPSWIRNAAWHATQRGHGRGLRRGAAA